MEGWREGGREADLKGRTHGLENGKLAFHEVELRDFFPFPSGFLLFSRSSAVISLSSNCLSD